MPNTYMLYYFTDYRTLHYPGCYGGHFRWQIRSSELFSG